MGSKQSTSKVAEKAAKDESKESEWFKEYEKQFIEKIAELEPLYKELKKQHNVGKVKADTWCDIMQKLVVSQQKANKTLFEQLHEPIKQSEAAYLHFQNLVKTNAIKDYPKRVDAAKNIYERYWKLLSETSMQLTKIMAKATVVVVDIEDYRLTRQNNSNNKKLSKRIENCVKSLNAWFLESKKIEYLAQKWNTLGDDAEKEKIEFEKIAQYLKSANAPETSLAVLGALAGVVPACLWAGFVALAAACPLIAVGLTAGGLAAGMAVVAYAVYCDTKENQFKGRFDTLRSIRFFQSTLSQIATSSMAINNLCIDLSEKLVENFEPNKDTISKNMQDISDNVSINRIDQSLNNISNAMVKFNDKCSKCCKEISKARENIVKCSKKNE